MPAKKKKSISKNRFFRLGLVLSTFCVLLTSTVLLVWIINRALFSKNNHFRMKYVDISSTGWWDNRWRKVCDELNLLPGKTNLFEVDLRGIRRKLENKPGIKRVTASRQLPDTLKINIIERIPRAFLGSRKAGWVVDSTGVVMSRNSCLNLDRNLPVILNYRVKHLKPGMELPSLKKALAVIMLTRTEFPDFKIAGIRLEGYKKLLLLVSYKDYPIYKVIMPASSLRQNLKILKSAIVRAIKKGDHRRTLDLNYKGQVVMRPL
jgi:hypothetical protein